MIMKPGLHNYEPPVPLRELIHDLQDKMDKQMDQQDELNKKVDRLFIIVLGDPDAQIPGLVHHAKDHGKYISRDKKIKWFGAGLAATGSTTAGLFQYWDSLKHFFGIK